MNYFKCYGKYVFIDGCFFVNLLDDHGFINIISFKAELLTTFIYAHPS